MRFSLLAWLIRSNAQPAARRSTAIRTAVRTAKPVNASLVAVVVEFDEGVGPLDAEATRGGFVVAVDPMVVVVTPVVVVVAAVVVVVGRVVVVVATTVVVVAATAVVVVVATVVVVVTVHDSVLPR